MAQRKLVQLSVIIIFVFLLPNVLSARTSSSMCGTCSSGNYCATSCKKRNIFDEGGVGRANNADKAFNETFTLLTKIYEDGGGSASKGLHKYIHIQYTLQYTILIYFYLEELRNQPVPRISGDASGGCYDYYCDTCPMGCACRNNAATSW